MLHSMGLLRVRHDWATELTDNIYKCHLQNVVLLLLYTLQHSHHQKFVSVNHHTVDSLYPFHFPHCHPSPVITLTLFSVSMCLFLFGLVCSFILLFVCFLYCTYVWNQIAFVFTCVFSSNLPCESVRLFLLSGEGNGKPIHYSWLENTMNNMKWLFFIFYKWGVWNKGESSWVDMYTFIFVCFSP